jgi:lipid-binding SYLF domain-containing protein
MNAFTRRHFLAAAGAPLALAACGNGIGSSGATRIDARTDQAFAFMFDRLPQTRALADKAAGVLMIPVVTEAGLFIGGAYGRGALRVNDVTVDYYSTTAASVGLQVGGQQYSHALFFMTQPALNNFRASTGWVAGADLEYALSSNAGILTTDTTALTTPVIAVVFGQAGLLAGASLEGTKYNRILP